jgi:hypothetical protein
MTASHDLETESALARKRIIEEVNELFRYEKEADLVSTTYRSKKKGIKIQVGYKDGLSDGEKQDTLKQTLQIEELNWGETFEIDSSIDD